MKREAKKRKTHPRLFQPGRIGSMQLANRIVMPAMGTNYANEVGGVTSEMIDYYVRRAQGGVGLIITEVCATATLIDPFRISCRTLRADDDCYIPGLYLLAEAVHNSGAKICLQLTTGGGAQARVAPSAGVGHMRGISRVSPSGIASLGSDNKPRELATQEVEKIIELQGLAAKRAKLADFDAIEIHGHDGYLTAQFLSPYFNKRTDKYGPDLESRLRFLLEIVASIRSNTGADFPLIVRYSIDEGFEGGREVKESQSIAKRLQEAGVDAIDVSRGVHGARLSAIPSMYCPEEGPFVLLAEATKEVVKIPVIVSGKLDNPDLAEQVLQDRKADFIGMGRQLLADPDMPKRIAEGHTEEIRRCIHCNECLQVFRPLRCTVNAVTGRESRYGTVERAEQVKKVMVIGAGPAGMEAARVAALRGHNVTLYDKANELGGGGLKLASTPPHKQELKKLTDYYSAVFKQMNNLKVELGIEVIPNLVKDKNPDTVIIAVGGIPVIPDIPGVEKGNVCTALDVLAGRAKVGETVTIVGGGLVGCETANLLAQQKKKVTIIEMLDTIGIEVSPYVWTPLSQELYEAGVKVMTRARVDEITNEGVIIINEKGNKTNVEAETVVLALGLKAAKEFAKALAGKAQEIYIIGDAKEPRWIKDAISEGYITGVGL